MEGDVRILADQWGIYLKNYSSQQYYLWFFQHSDCGSKALLRNIIVHILWNVDFTEYDIIHGLGA